MIIQIGENYRIVPDGKGYSIEEMKITKEGKNKGQERWEFYGYYPSLESTVSAILKKSLDNVRVDGIQNIINEFKTGVQTLCEQIKVLSNV